MKAIGIISAAFLASGFALTPASAEAPVTAVVGSSLVDGQQVTTSSLAKPPKPLAFNGGHALRVAAVRQRLLSQTLEYTLTVDADGSVSGCDLAYDFRLRATEYALCRPFEKHMTFEPALDETGAPTAGTYTFELGFDMFLTQDGYMEERFR